MNEDINIRNGEDEFKDFGLGSKISKQKERLLNKDGSFNVKREGIPLHLSLSFYHELINMSWLKFNLLIVVSFLLINIFFAFLYNFAGIEELRGITSSANPIDRFMEAFFFSSQTLTTVGFGRISPAGIHVSIIAAIESMMGLLGFALATGLLYGRFSKPNSKIIYSSTAIIAPYKDINALMFRIINARKNQLIELDVQVVFSKIENVDGEYRRRYYPLELERNKVSFFPLNWTIVHPITKSSPLYHTDAKKLEELNAEILIVMKAFDETFAQTVHSRSSYRYNEITWGAKYENPFTNIEGEITKFDMDLFHSVKDSELNKY